MEEKIVVLNTLIKKVELFKLKLLQQVERTKKAQGILALLPHAESKLRDEITDVCNLRASEILFYVQHYDIAREEARSYYYAELSGTGLLPYLPSALEILVN